MKRFLSVLFFLFCFCQVGYAEDIYSGLKKKDSILVTDFHNNIIFSKNPDSKLVPASIIKILTSLSAFYHLGEDFRFKTEFYITKNRDLVIKGFGDPMLISEVIIKVVDQISGLKIMQSGSLNNIILDDSYYSNETIPGSVKNSSEPYDSQTGALCVNFNTVNFKTDKNGLFVTAEPQTPLLPFVMKRIKQTGLKHGRVILTGKDKKLYPGYLFKYFLMKKKIRVSGKIIAGKVNPDVSRLFYTYTSDYKLSQLVEKLLEYSNNFIANQIFLASGVKKFGSPANLEKSIKATAVFTETLNKKLKAGTDYYIEEGSGLSRKNFISARSMDIILQQFKNRHNLMRRNRSEFYKTGTLTGVSTRAGYLLFNDQKKYRYVIICNSPGISSKSIIKKLTLLLEP